MWCPARGGTSGRDSANIDKGGSHETRARLCLPVIDVISRVGQLPAEPRCLDSSYDTFTGRKHLYGVLFRQILVTQRCVTVRPDYSMLLVEVLGREFSFFVPKISYKKS